VDFPCVGSDGGGHDDRADHSGEQAGHQGTGGLGGEFDASARALLVMCRIRIRLGANPNSYQDPTINLNPAPNPALPSYCKYKSCIYSFSFVKFKFLKYLVTYIFGRKFCKF